MAKKLATAATSMAQSIPTLAIAEPPRTSGCFDIRWEKKIVDGKKVVSYSFENQRPYVEGKTDQLKKEFTDKDEFLGYIEKALEGIPGDVKE